MYEGLNESLSLSSSLSLFSEDNSESLKATECSLVVCPSDYLFEVHMLLSDEDPGCSLNRFRGTPRPMQINFR